MTKLAREALVPYSAEQMFTIVNDVCAYPSFLPWCESAQIDEASESAMSATLTLARAGLRYSFSTRNTLSFPDRITMELIKGPFSHLYGEWDFIPLGEDGCRVRMQLDFEVGGRVARTALGSVFNKAADTMVDAFCDRADKLHG